MDPSNNDDGGIVEEDGGNSEGESYWDALDLSGVRLRALSVNICHCMLSPPLSPTHICHFAIRWYDLHNAWHP